MKPVVQTRPVRGAFDQGQSPRIACFNKAVTPLGVDFAVLIAALQAYVDLHVAPVWATPAKLVRTAGFVRGQWAMVFLDDADAPGALAYHDLTPDGLPLSKVFVRTILQNRDLVSVAASHELVEMLVDPALNILTTGPRLNAAYAYEAADPVEELAFPVLTLPMSDFVHPAYFEAFRPARSARFDHMGAVTRPFQILAGGYQILMVNGKWRQVFGSERKATRFAAEDRRGHRSDLRAKRHLKLSLRSR